MTKYVIYTDEAKRHFLTHECANPHLQPLVDLINEHYAEYAAFFVGEKNKAALAVGNRKFFEKLLARPPFPITGWYSTGRGIFAFDFDISIRETQKLPRLVFDDFNVKLLNSDKITIITKC